MTVRKKVVTSVAISFYLVLFTGSAFAEQNLDQKLEQFLAAPTDKAKDLLSQFTDSELEQVYNKYRNGKTIEEQRKLWLIEDSFNRKADRVAASRLKYLAIGVITLMVLVLYFSWNTYRLQQNIDRR